MSDDLPVTPGLTLPGDELEEVASRGGGPGGQHVNKTSTRISLRWNLLRSRAPTDAQRGLLLERLGSRLTSDGDLVVHVDSHRSQLRNREEARARLASVLAASLQRDPPRRPTRPTRSSETKRRETKLRRGRVKALRGKVDD